MTEGKGGEKRVTFRLDSEKSSEENQERKAEILTEVSKIIKEEVKELEDRLNKKLEVIGEKVRVDKEHIENLRKRDNEWEKKWEETRKRLKEIEGEILEKVVNWVDERRRETEESISTSEENTRRGVRGEREAGPSREGSRIGSRIGSTSSIWSEDRLSNKEVGKVRKWVNEREREERKDNIILRGVTIPETEAGERRKRQNWVKELINSKLGVICEVGEVKRSGPVIVAKIIGEDKKKEIMRNKHKLKGGNIYIENDLSFEDRKIQEKLSKWARGKRSAGIEVKVGRGRVKIRDRWMTWEDIEREERTREEREGIAREDRGARQELEREERDNQSFG